MQEEGLPTLKGVYSAMGENLLAFWGDGYGSSRFSFDSEGKRNGAKIAVEFDPAWYARTRTAIAVDRLPHV